MNFSSNASHSIKSGTAICTSAVAEVAAHAPSIVKYTTGASVEEFTLVNTWTVKGLKALGEGTLYLESTPLTHQNSSKWCMVLTQKGSELHLCFLLKKSESSKVLRAKLRAEEVLPTGTVREVFPSEWCNLKEGEKSESWVIRNADTVGEGSGNEIVLQCKVTMHCIVQDELPAPDAGGPQAEVVRAVGEMLHEQVLADFEVRLGGTALKAHRALLAVQSPYFAAMLQPHTKEAKEGFVELLDVEQALLHMYTGEAPALKEMPLELLIVADKLQLDRLKRQCEAHFARGLSVENVAKAAASAWLYSCDLLWDRAVLYVKHNLCHVMRSPGWAEVVTLYPEVIKCISEMMG